MLNDSYHQEFKESFRKVALPVGLQNLLFISLSFVDSLMVGRLGQVEYNAVGLATQYKFIVNLVVVGLSSALVIYMSQYYGKDDKKGFHSALGLALIMTTGFGLICGLVGFFLPNGIMALYTKDMAIIKEGADYLKIIAFELPLMAMVFPLAMASRASKNAKLPLYISGIAFSCNTILNYLLIFGNFGFPELAVKGAALATLLARIMSLLLYLIILNTRENYLKAPLKEYFDISKTFVLKVFSTGWTVILHETLWSLGISTFILILSQMTTDGYTSYQIAVQIWRFNFMFAMAISSSASVTIGQLLGRNEIEKALNYERLYSRVQIIVGVFAGLFVIAITYLFIDFFNVSESIRRNAFYIAIALSVFLPILNYNAMQAAGILRAGGDTKVPVFIELSGIYFIEIPLLYLLLKYSDLPIAWIIFCTNFGLIVVFLALRKRVKTGKWARNLVG